MRHRRMLVLKQITRDSAEARRLLAALEREPVGTADGRGRHAWAQQFTATGKAAGKPPISG
jgi:hypothetical protein